MIVIDAACLPLQMHTSCWINGQAEFRLVDHVYRFISDISRRLLSTLKELFRNKISNIRINTKLSLWQINSNKRISKSCHHVTDFDRSKLTMIIFEYHYCSFYYSSDSNELKTIITCVIEKTKTYLSRHRHKAHMNVSSGLKTMENPSKHSQITLPNKRDLKPCFKPCQTKPKKRHKTGMSEVIDKTVLTKYDYDGIYTGIKCAFHDTVGYKYSIKYPESVLHK